MKLNNNIKKLFKSLSEHSVNIFIFLMLTLFPLIVHDYYFNITQVKFMTFMVLSILIFFAALSANDRRRKDRTDLKPPISHRLISSAMSLSPGDMFMLAFIIINIIGCIGSEWKKEALIGNHCNYTGLAFVLALGLMYYGVSRYAAFTNWIKLSFPVTLIIISSMSLIQYCGYDIFGFYEGVRMPRAYMATLGNINVYSAFLCAYMPICMYMFCREEGKTFILYGISLFFGFLGCLCCSSDSVYLGLIAAIAVIFIAATRHTSFLRRYGFMLCIAALSLISYVKIRERFADTVWDISKLNLKASDPKVIKLLFLAGVIIIIFSSLMKIKFGRLPKLTSYILSGAFILGIIFVIICVIHFSTKDLQTDLGELGEYIRFTPDWGSGRGLFWMWSMWMFMFSNPFIKMFGSGPATAGLMTYKYFEAEIWMERGGIYGSSVHNEYLNYLITNGMFGLLAYLALLAVSVRKCCIKAANEPFLGAVGAGIIAYSAMASVNINQPITVPFIFLFAAFANTKSTEAPPLKASETEN